MTDIAPLMPTYAPSDVTFVRGEGSWLYDTDGTLLAVSSATWIAVPHGDTPHAPGPHVSDAWRPG